MPRHPRIHAAGLLYHIMARGNNGQKVFLGKRDYEDFLIALGTVRERYPFYLYGYVLMPNHFHLLLEVVDYPTARIMQSLLTLYVKRFNTLHHRRGHLFQGRYKAIVCDRDSYLLELVRYIHLNAVRAGLVKRPVEWPWSGHGEYLKTENRRLIDSGAVMEELGTPRRYEAFVREGVKESYRAEWHPGDQAPFLGTKGFVKKIAREREPAPSPQRMPMKDLLIQVASAAGLNPDVLGRRGRAAKVAETRDLFMWRAVTEQGYRGSEIAAFLGCDPSNVSRALQKIAQRH